MFLPPFYRLQSVLSHYYSHHNYDIKPGDNLSRAPVAASAAESPPSSPESSAPVSQPVPTRERVDSNAIPEDMFGPVPGSKPKTEDPAKSPSSGEVPLPHYTLIT